MGLSWITVCWSLLAGGYLAIGISQVIAWSNQTRQTWRLALGVLGLSLAFVALFELAMMRAQTPAEYGMLMRWIHVPLFALYIAILMFVRGYLGAGRLWLVYGVLGLRVLTLILGLYLDPNLHYEQLLRLELVDFFGVEVASVAVGVPSRWRWIGPLSSLLLLLFLMDAIGVCWRRGGRDNCRRAVAVGGSLAFCVLFAAVHAGSIQSGLISSVYLISPPFLLVMVAIGLEMRAEGLQSALLAVRLRKSEDDLHISEERLADATHAAKLGLWEWDIARDAFWATTQARDLFCIGLSEKIDFDRFLQALRQEDRDTARAVAARALETGEGFSIEYRVSRPDGQVRWIQSRGGVYPGETGKAARMHGVSFDITDRKETETAMKGVQARLASAMELAAMGSYELSGDAAETTVSVDQRMRALLGVPDGGSSDFRAYWLEHIHPEDRERILASSQAMLQRQIDHVAVDYRYQHPLRGLMWFNHISRAVKPDREHGHIQLIGVVQDITERKQSELEIAQQRSELAHLARVALLSELSGSIAHEMNQPLAAILSNAQAALRFMRAETPDLDEVREILEDIVADDRRAGEVIQGLRLLLKRGVMRRDPFDMNQVVLDVLRLVHSNMVTADVSVSTALAPDLPPAIGDRVQMQQVVLNLVMNGCDAMADVAVVAGRKLLIRTELTEGKHILVCVADAGTGVPPEHMERIFQSFFSTKAQGLGLGLSVCRQIISAHNGRLWFENNAGPGTTFYIDVPAESSAAP